MEGLLMLKNILKNSIILLLSLIASWALHYFIISNVLMRFMESSNILSISIMMFIAFIFYKEPGAVVPHAGICAGGVEQSMSLP
jgi:uncharacterized membrane protein YraQ (UPF0718 family)